MKKLVILVGIIMIQMYGFAQTPDRIITVSGDTLKVYVTVLKENVVVFRLEDKADAPVLHMPTRRIAKLESNRIGHHDFTYGNPRLQRKNGIAVAMEYQDYYDLLLGISYDYFTRFGLRYYGYAGASEWSNYDLRVGLFYHFDSRYNKRGFSPYVGVTAGTDEIEDFVNIAAGLMYNTPSGFFADVQVYRRLNIPEDIYMGNQVFIGLRLGQRW